MRVKVSMCFLFLRSPANPKGAQISPFLGHEALHPQLAPRGARRGERRGEQGAGKGDQPRVKEGGGERGSEDIRIEVG